MVKREQGILEDLADLKELEAALTLLRSRHGVNAEVKKNPAAVALGKLGGLKGGAARASKLSQEQRTEIARKAAMARWANK